MKILFFTPTLINTPLSKPEPFRCSPYANNQFAPLKFDTISFGAMKKNQFEGLDLACVQHFKAPIEKFNINDDLQNWSKTKLEKEYIDKDFGGRQQETKIQRKAMIKEWGDYVTKENDAYTPTTQLLIMNAVTKDLKPDNDALPPVLNQGILAATVDEIDTNMRADNKYSFDINKIYQNKLRTYYLDDVEDSDTGETETKWVEIPSKEHDPENFDKNVDKLKMLSHGNWCTKSFNAKPYLGQGDFHVYLENGQPKLGVRFIGSSIEEIQGEKNNCKIPIKYFDEANNHIKESNYKCRTKASNEIKNAEVIKNEINIINENIGDDIKTNNADNILKYFNFKIEENSKTGLLTIDKYKQPSEKYTFGDIGIDEDKLFKKIESIDGDANFRNSNLKNFGNLKNIGGNADFKYSKIKNLGNLENIGGNADFNYSKIENFGSLNYIGGSAVFLNSQMANSITSKLIPCPEENPEKVFKLFGVKVNNNPETGLLTIDKYQQPSSNYSFNDLGIDENKLLECVESINGSADFSNSQVKNLWLLENIGGDANFSNSKLENIPLLENIEGCANFSNSKIKNLEALKHIGETANFSNSNLENIPLLEGIGGNAIFSNSKIKTLEVLKHIGKDANFCNSNIERLPSLEAIGGSADFSKSKIKNLGVLKAIGGNAIFCNSNITKLSPLKKIGGLANFRDSQVNNIGNLEYIGGNIFLNGKLKESDFDNIKRNSNAKKSKIF